MPGRPASSRAEPECEIEEGQERRVDRVHALQRPV